MNETAKVPENQVSARQGHEAEGPAAEDSTGPMRRFGLARLVWLVGIVLVSLGTVTVAASFLLTARVLNSDLADQIQQTTGFLTTTRGDAHFSLLPRPEIEIDHIDFANPQAALTIEANSFVGYLRLLPLLVGRVEIGHAVLYQPKMTIDVNDRPMTADSAIGRAARAKSASPEAAALDRTKLAIVDIVGGSASLHGAKATPDYNLDNINVTADWRSLDASATLTGQINFRNVPMTIKAWFARPIALLRGGSSSTTVELESDAVKLFASGEIAAGPPFQYKGRLTVASPSLRGLVQLVGLPFAKHGRFADFSLRCDVNMADHLATFTNLALALDGNNYEGTLAVQADAHTQELSGTLATSFLDVTPFLDGLPPPRGANGQWNDAPLELTDLGFTNLDLRVSASRLRLNDMELRNAALAVLTRPGFIDLTLGEATANGGAIRGHVSLSGQGKSFDLRAMASAADVNIAPMLRGQTVRHPLSGALSGSFMLEGQGDSFDALMHSLTGHAELSVANGQIIGIDLASALRAHSTRELVAQTDPSQNVTSVDQADVSLAVAHGVAALTDGTMRGADMTGRFGGNADLGNQTADLWLQAHALPSSGQAAPATPLRLGLSGPWNDVDLHVEPAASGLSQ